ncbi:hypothetical protein [Salinibius halmophilus]|uniref:hypothetical protein n=1 Tax=Salinibius halmophilus TaxID=1853216 RepID=UPI000E662F00|nr:hypothetical protein [Salinibius halmophilus]
MRWTVIALPIFLTACASKDLSWIDQEGQAPQVLPASDNALYLPEGTRTPAENLAVPTPPELELREVALNLEPGEVIDGNGVPVLNLNMTAVQALNLLLDNIEQYDINIVEVNDSGSLLTIQSESFQLEGNPSWFNRFDQRLRISFADIGSQSRISVWRYDNTQPEPELRAQVFDILSEILIETEM